MENQLNLNLLTEHLARPRNRGALPGANGRAVYNDLSGNALGIYLRIEQGRILESRWQAFGDPVLGAIASFVTECVTGQEIETAAAIPAEDVARTLRVPQNSARFVHVVMLTMLDAIQDNRRHHGLLHGRVGS